jgi:hypothetical protein
LEAVVDLHRRWRVFRRSLRGLTTVDAEARRKQRAGRTRQLDAMARLRPAAGDRARDLLLLYTVERVADALAEEEPEELGVRGEELLALLETPLAARLAARGHARIAI